MMNNSTKRDGDDALLHEFFQENGYIASIDVLSLAEAEVDRLFLSPSLRKKLVLVRFLPVPVPAPVPVPVNRMRTDEGMVHLLRRYSTWSGVNLPPDCLIHPQPSDFVQSVLSRRAYAVRSTAGAASQLVVLFYQVINLLLSAPTALVVHIVVHGWIAVCCAGC